MATEEEIKAKKEETVAKTKATKAANLAKRKAEAEANETSNDESTSDETPLSEKENNTVQEKRIADMLKEAKTLPDFKKCEHEANVVFKNNIPAGLHKLAEQCYRNIVNKNPKKTDVSEDGYIDMTIEEKDKYEKAGRLVGWNEKYKRGLLNAA